jgi:glycine cleavage system H protein
MEIGARPPPGTGNMQYRKVFYTMKDIPETRRFTRWHVWIEMEDDFIGRCGIADRYLEIIDIIEFVEFPDMDIEVRREEQVALAESEKAFFGVLSPVSGRITEINSLLERDPSRINADPYGEGWIYKIDVKEPNELHDLMDEAHYNSYMDNGGDI